MNLPKARCVSFFVDATRGGGAQNETGTDVAWSHDFVATQYHRTQVRMGFRRSTGEYALRTSSALVTLGRNSAARENQSPVSQTTPGFSIGFAGR